MRQERGWSQAQLVQKLKVYQKQISAYERGVHASSTDFLMRMAEWFNVSLDYLTGDARADKSRVALSDRDLIDKLVELERLPEKDTVLLVANQSCVVNTPGMILFNP